MTNPFSLITEDPRLRHERRAEHPPEHPPDEPERHPMLTAEELRERARRRLEEWRRDHG